MNTIFNKFNTAVDSFDFNLKKNRDQVYVSEVAAISQGKWLEKKVIVLETKDLELAIKKALKVINKAAREVAPGIQENGDLRNRTTIKLVPSQPQYVQTNRPTQIVPGIYIVEDEDFEDDDMCDGCELYDECHSDDYDDEDYDDVNDNAEELIAAFAKFIRKVSR